MNQLCLLPCTFSLLAVLYVYTRLWTLTSENIPSVKMLFTISKNHELCHVEAPRVQFIK